MSNHTMSSQGEQDAYTPFLGDESKNFENDDYEYQILHQGFRDLKRQLYCVSILFGVASTFVLVSLWDPSFSPMMISKRPSPMPILPITTVTFERDDRFSSVSSPESDQAWNSLMPEGNGFVIIPNHEHFSLPAGKQTAQGEAYDVSLFHQLHCLSSIRSYLYTLKASVELNNTDVVNEVLLKKQDEHLLHCFDYLRQGIMCAGDMTLEWPKEQKDGDGSKVDGWGVEHQCKSWEAITAYMEDHGVRWK